MYWKLFPHLSKKNRQTLREKRQLKSDLFLKVASKAFPEIIFNIFYIFSKMLSAIQNETKAWRAPESLELPKFNLNFISPHNNYQDRNLAYCVLEGFYITRMTRAFWLIRERLNLLRTPYIPVHQHFTRLPSGKRNGKMFDLTNQWHTPISACQVGRYFVELSIRLFHHRADL